MCQLYGTRHQIGDQEGMHEDRSEGPVPDIAGTAGHTAGLRKNGEIPYCIACSARHGLLQRLQQHEGQIIDDR